MNYFGQICKTYILISRYNDILAEQVLYKDRFIILYCEDKSKDGHMIFDILELKAVV